MTASPTDAGAGMPSEHYAESAYCLPSEEEVRRIVDDALNSAIPEPWEVSAHAAQRILALIRPAFEAKEREIERHREMRKRLDRRIHCQRKANRDNWEIVESRRKWLGSQTAQRAFIHMRNRALSAEAKLAQAVEAREQDALGLDDWAYKWLVSLRPETDERETFKDGYFSGAVHVLGKVRDRARMIADVDAVSIRNEERTRSASARGEK